MKVEIMVGVLVNGRPIWRMAQEIKSEMTLRMGDDDYDKVVSAAALQLERQVVMAKKKEAAVASKGDK